VIFVPYVRAVAWMIRHGGISTATSNEGKDSLDDP